MIDISICITNHGKLTYFLLRNLNFFLLMVDICYIFYSCYFTRAWCVYVKTYKHKADLLPYFGWDILQDMQ